MPPNVQCASTFFVWIAIYLFTKICIFVQVVHVNHKNINLIEAYLNKFGLPLQDHEHRSGINLDAS